MQKSAPHNHFPRFQKSKRPMHIDFPCYMLTLTHRKGNPSPSGDHGVAWVISDNTLSGILFADMENPCQTRWVQFFEELLQSYKKIERPLVGLVTGQRPFVKDPKGLEFLVYDCQRTRTLCTRRELAGIPFKSASLSRGTVSAEILLLLTLLRLNLMSLFCRLL